MNDQPNNESQVPSPVVSETEAAAPELEPTGAVAAESQQAAPAPTEEAAPVEPETVQPEAVEEAAPAVDTGGQSAGEAVEEAAAEPVEELQAEPVDEPSEEQPIEEVALEEAEGEEEPEKNWYILKVQVNREDSIREAILRRIKIEGLEKYFGDIVVPTEDVAEFDKNGKRRVVKKKLYPGYILIHMAINDDTWFLIRETPGVGDFTGSAGKPTPMETHEVERILKLGAPDEEGTGQVRTAIPFKPGDRVRVKDGYFLNFEGDVETIDEANGRITVMINIFGRSTPVELEHWQVESV